MKPTEALGLRIHTGICSSFFSLLSLVAVEISVATITSG